MWKAKCSGSTYSKSVDIEVGGRSMSKSAIFCLILTLWLCLPARADSSREDDVRRIQESAEVFQEIMNTPDKAIPQELLESAKCIAIIPAEKKFAFFVGGNYGKGVVTCRTAHGWSAPLFLAVGGGSFGFQWGGTSTDVILVFFGERGLNKLLGNKFQIGADATAAAGPVGRHAAAGTDITLHAEILTYSRSRGVFAGISLNGAVIQPDDSGNEAMYGHEVNRRDVLSGKVAVPPQANVLVKSIEKGAR
jgi:lipid-binding SYLF domain-containing protein